MVEDECEIYFSYSNNVVLLGFFSFNLLELFLVLAVHPDEIVPKSSFNLKIQGQFPVVNEGSRNTSCCLVVFGVVTTLEPESTVIIPHSKITFNA